MNPTCKLAGTLLDGRYRIEDFLARGGMGDVYRAIDLRFSRNGRKKSVAVKLLRREFVRDARLRTRFEREACTASNLEHENIVSVFDTGVTSDGLPYLVMELLRGTTLDEALSETPRQRMSWATARAIVLQLCDALHYAHEQGVIHRDLKPGNVFLINRTGRPHFVKLLDFGIAKLLDEASQNMPQLTGMDDLVGTLNFMAPEQLEGADIDHRADIYAVGVILYRMLTGKALFYHRDPRQVAKAISGSTPPPPSTRVSGGLSVEIDRLVLKTLAKRREMRFSSVAALAEAVRAIPAPVEGPPRAVVHKPSMRREPSVIWNRPRSTAKKRRASTTRQSTSRGKRKATAPGLKRLAIPEAASDEGRTASLTPAPPTRPDSPSVNASSEPGAPATDPKKSTVVTRGGAGLRKRRAPWRFLTAVGLATATVPLAAASYNIVNRPHNVRPLVEPVQVDPPDELEAETTLAGSSLPSSEDLIIEEESTGGSTEADDSEPSRLPPITALLRGAEGSSQVLDTRDDEDEDSAKRPRRSRPQNYDKVIASLANTLTTECQTPWDPIPSVTVEMTIASSGRVFSVEIKDAESKTFKACVEERVKDTTFDKVTQSATFKKTFILM